MNNLPKPAIIGVAVLVLVIALVLIFRTVKGGGENSAYGSKEEIDARQAAGMAAKSSGQPGSSGSPASSGRPSGK